MRWSDNGSLGGPTSGREHVDNNPWLRCSSSGTSRTHVEQRGRHGTPATSSSSVSVGSTFARASTLLPPSVGDHDSRYGRSLPGSPPSVACHAEMVGCASSTVTVRPSYTERPRLVWWKSEVAGRHAKKGAIESTVVGVVSVGNDRRQGPLPSTPSIPLLATRQGPTLFQRVVAPLGIDGGHSPLRTDGSEPGSAGRPSGPTSVGSDCRPQGRCTPGPSAVLRGCYVPAITPGSPALPVSARPGSFERPR